MILIAFADDARANLNTPDPGCGGWHHRKWLVCLASITMFWSAIPGESLSQMGVGGRKIAMLAEPEFDWVTPAFKSAVERYVHWT